MSSAPAEIQTPQHCHPAGLGGDWAAHAARTAEFYDRLVDTYGHDPRACDYGSRATQLRKLEVLAEVAPLGGKRVLDIGCGFADFADVALRRGGALAYEGVDLSAAMVREARKLRPTLTIGMRDVFGESAAPTPSHDFVIANGIFYLLSEEPWARMQFMIARMFAMCREGIAFTSLSTWAGKRTAGEFQADPLQTVEFCRTLSSRVVFRHDYLPHDFAIYVYREPA